MKIKAVIFDLFGTLIDSFNKKEFKQILSEMASSLSLPVESFYNLWYNSFNQRALGIFESLEESFKFIANQLNKPLDRKGIDQAINIRFKYSEKTLVPRDDAISTLKLLNKRGLRIGLISDCTYEIPSIWGRSLLAQHFDSVVFSCIVGIKKPDPRIYRLTCKKLKVKPRNCLYIGDGSSSELTGALQVGMFPILIRSPSEADSVRYEEEEWDGPRISSLSEVLNYIDN